jgi:predicted small metal-binding protein
MPSLRCPCDMTLRGDTDDELVEKVQEHLAAEHPGREYSREEILFRAM